VEASQVLKLKDGGAAAAAAAAAPTAICPIRTQESPSSHSFFESSNVQKALEKRSIAS
jgi:hypothetical protein